MLLCSGAPHHLDVCLACIESEANVYRLHPRAREHRVQPVLHESEERERTVYSQIILPDEGRSRKICNQPVARAFQNVTTEVWDDLRHLEQNCPHDAAIGFAV